MRWRRRRRTVGAMNEQVNEHVNGTPGNDTDRVLSVQLDVHLDRQPISGWLRAKHGAHEHFVGWLGFVDALERLHEDPNRKEQI